MPPFPTPAVPLISGTWLAADEDPRQNPSNVTYIYNSIIKTPSLVPSTQDYIAPRTYKDVNPPPSETDVQQLSFYFPGIGTHDVSTLHRLFCAASGAGLVEKVREAYVSIIRHWAPGDEIYLFGFSRGAYTVRTVGALIAKYGLLKPESMIHFYEILKMLQKRRPGQSKSSCFGSSEKEEPPWEGIKTDDWLAQKVKVKCIGVWDTVGSCGIPATHIFGIEWDKLACIRTVNKKYAFPDQTVHKNIEFAFQAYSPYNSPFSNYDRLAMDEKRASFFPSLWARNKAKNTTTVLKQTWFPGCHASVGGSEHSQALSDIPLAWMVSQLEEHNLPLALDKPYLQAKGGKTHPSAPWGCAPWEESFTGVYYLAGTHHREPGAYGNFGKKKSRSGRKWTEEDFETFEEIHESVRNRVERSQIHSEELRGEYKPHALRKFPLAFPVRHLPPKIAVLGKLEHEFKWE